jgi:hypothetical protein
MSSSFSLPQPAKKSTPPATLHLFRAAAILKIMDSRRQIRRGGPALLLLAVLTLPAALPAQENVSSGGTIESDIYRNADSPPEALIDGIDTTHYCHHRLEDADWRMVLATPAEIARVTFIQGWQDWDQVTRIGLESADGTQVVLDLQPGTRDPQTLEAVFPAPTAFLDVTVLAVADDGDDDTWGGFAEMAVEGYPAPGDGAPPAVSAIVVSPLGDTSADVSWTTDEPATSQVRFSSAGGVAVTPPDLELVTEHVVHIEGTGRLTGRVEIRSADAGGRRAEIRVDAFTTIDTAYAYGVGGWSFNIDDTWVPAPELFAADGMRVGFIQQWVGSAMEADWMRADDVRGIDEAGYVPEIIHYYFGDPTVEKVESMRADFVEDIRYLADLIAASGAGDRVIVTLEPEFNQGGVERWDGFNDLMIEAVTLLHDTAGCRVGVLAGDWDIDHVLPISMGRAAAVSDFVAFQEMRASTRDEEQDAHDVVDRAITFSHDLSRKFLMPVRWGYVMVSDYGGWTEVQRETVVELCERRPELEASGVVAVSWMSYMDSPGSGGYFDQAEAHKGLKHADNDPKPAWYVWKECLASGPTWADGGTWPDGGEPCLEAPGGCGCGVVR